MIKSDPTTMVSCDFQDRLLWFPVIVPFFVLRDFRSSSFGLLLLLSPLFSLFYVKIYPLPSSISANAPKIGYRPT